MTSLIKGFEAAANPTSIARAVGSKIEKGYDTVTHKKKPKPPAHPAGKTLAGAKPKPPQTINPDGTSTPPVTYQQYHQKILNGTIKGKPGQVHGYELPNGSWVYPDQPITEQQEREKPTMLKYLQTLDLTKGTPLLKAQPKKGVTGVSPLTPIPKPNPPSFDPMDPNWYQHQLPAYQKALDQYNKSKTRTA